MQTAHRYEELLAWQLCTELCALVFSLTDSEQAIDDSEFRDQIRRAAQNAPALIAEGFLRYTPDEFVHYLRMARGELGEVQSRLGHARSQEYFTEEEYETAATLARRAMAVTTGLLKSKLPLVRKRPQPRRTRNRQGT